jgi:1-acyl-sn-glycerol-3-phosphate acyltransferase
MLIGLPLALLSFSSAGKSIQVGATSLNEWMIRWWSRWVCRTFGVRIRPGSTLPAPPMLIVANHSSWLDILVLSSLGHLHFVSKAEIARWPLIGTVAKVAGVIFHSRGSSDSLTDAADAVKKALQSGGYAAIFPEGGVNDAISVNRFHARLFKAAIESGSPVQPVCIRYTRHGAINVETSFRGQESTSRNMLRLLIAPGCEAVLSILPVVLPGEKSRRQIAEEAQALVSNEYGSDCD